MIRTFTKGARDAGDRPFDTHALTRSRYTDNPPQGSQTAGEVLNAH